MTKPPFPNVLSAPWFDMCTVWFVASLSYINMLVMSCLLVQYQALRPQACGPGLVIINYKPDIALVTTYTCVIYIYNIYNYIYACIYIYIYIYIHICIPWCVGDHHGNL